MGIHGAMISNFRCCCCKPCCKGSNSDFVRDDNCCECNLVALKRISGLPDADLVYVTYHVDVSTIIAVTFEPCSVKRGLNASVKSIDPCQPAQSAMCPNLLCSNTASIKCA